MAKKENKAGQTDKKKLSKAAYLSQKIAKQVDDVLSSYEDEQKIEIAEHLKELFKEVGEYFKTRDQSILTTFANRQIELLKKYGKTFKPYTRQKFHRLFDYTTLLVEMEYYSNEEFNALKDQNNDLTESDVLQFTRTLSDLIDNELYFFYLDREPKFEVSQKEKVLKDPDDKEMTEARQLLAIYYLLKSGFGIEHRGTNSVSQVTRFAHLLLGKQFSSLEVSNIYKKYKTIPNYNSGEQLIKDLKYIKPFFEELDIRKAIDLINNELSLTISEFPQSKRKNYL